MVELHFMSLHHRGHTDASLEDAEAILAIGFCELCGHLVTESNVTRRELEGACMLFCSEDCETRLVDGQASPGQMYSYHW